MTGWTWEQVRQEMTLPRLRTMQRLWARHPPTHILVAGYLGYKPDADDPAPAAKDETTQDLGELFQLFPAAGGIVQHG